MGPRRIVILVILSAACAPLQGVAYQWYGDQVAIKILGVGLTAYVHHWLQAEILHVVLVCSFSTAQATADLQLGGRWKPARH